MQKCLNPVVDLDIVSSHLHVSNGLVIIFIVDILLASLNFGHRKYKSNAGCAPISENSIIGVEHSNRVKKKKKIMLRGLYDWMIAIDIFYS